MGLRRAARAKEEGCVLEWTAAEWNLYNERPRRVSGKGLQPERAAARRDDVTSDGTKKGGEPSGWLEGRGSDAGALVCRRKGLTVLQGLRLVLKICRLLLGNVDQCAGNDDSWKNGGGVRFNKLLKW